MAFCPSGLSSEAIELSASALLDDFYGSSSKRTYPIQVESIAEFHLGYDLVFTDEGLYQDPNFLGGICFIKNEIFINAALENYEGRMAFTIAHEIGHHVLHKKAYLEYLAGEAPEILCRELANKPIIEKQADQFAAALLMPRNFLLEHWPFGEIRDVYQAFQCAQKFKSKHGLDNVSTSAMVNRLIDLGIFKDMPYQTGKPKRNKQFNPLSILKYKIKKLLK